MLKNRVTLGNISRFLSHIIKRLIFAMFEDSSPFTSVHAVVIHILIHEVQLLLAALFSCLICLVSVMICIFNSQEFIYGKFEDCLGLCNFHYCSLLGKTPATMAMVFGHLFTI